MIFKCTSCWQETAALFDMAGACIALACLMKNMKILWKTYNCIAAALLSAWSAYATVYILDTICVKRANWESMSFNHECCPSTMLTSRYAAFPGHLRGGLSSCRACCGKNQPTMYRWNHLQSYGWECSALWSCKDCSRLKLLVQIKSKDLLMSKSCRRQTIYIYQ